MKNKKITRNISKKPINYVAIYHLFHYLNKLIYVDEILKLFSSFEKYILSPIRWLVEVLNL